MPRISSPNPGNDDIYTVSRLNRAARQLVEGALGSVWVNGEISNLVRPASGHLYFTLKDRNAQLRCAMFRSANRRLAEPPADGDQVVVRGKVSIYEARGDYQLIVDKLEPAGEGLLRRKFEELKAALDAAGLFATEHKQPLPAVPRCIGVVTSPTGAAIRDILQILRRRYPAAPVIIYPTRVQGNEAADEIVAAIRSAVTHAACDVLIIARGGGSLEDLWPFNEERVARAIYDCALPTVAGIGHEVDVTIADLVADVRAPTPSGAAELIAPDRAELLRNLASLQQRNLRAVRHTLIARGQLSVNLQRRLQRMHPGSVLDQARQRMDELNRRMTAGLDNRVAGLRSTQTTLALRLRHVSPARQLARYQEQLVARQRELGSLARRRIEQLRSRTAIVAGRLHAVSPLATLDRGYAIVQTTGGNIVRSSSMLRAGDVIRARLAAGEVEATVDTVLPPVTDRGN